MAIIGDGQTLSNQKYRQLQPVIQQLTEKGITPKLVWISIGDTPENVLYGTVKQKAAEKLGIIFENITVQTDEQLIDLPAQLSDRNQDSSVHGIMLQLPATMNGQRLDPQQLTTILSLIHPHKDVDCLSPSNLGKLVIGAPTYLPATLASTLSFISDAIQQLYQSDATDWLIGKRVVIVGGGLEIGKPAVNLLSNLGATVIWARSTESSLKSLTQQADLIISATGQPSLITEEHIAHGCICIDVGSPQPDFQLDHQNTKAAYITPVPRGVGPLTVACLMEHTVAAAQVALLQQTT